MNNNVQRERKYNEEGRGRVGEERKERGGRGRGLEVEEESGWSLCMPPSFPCLDTSDFYLRYRYKCLCFLQLWIGNTSIKFHIGCNTL